MRNTIKAKVGLTLLMIGVMFGGTVSAYAGTLRGMGERSLSADETTIAVANKTTVAGYTNLTLNDVSIYDSIYATTYSQTPAGNYIQSNPWTICKEYSTTYMGQYMNQTTYVGQGIKLLAKRSVYASTDHAAAFSIWEYK